MQLESVSSSDEDGSVASDAESEAESAAEIYECPICLDETDASARFDIAGCDHSMCKTCVHRLAQNGHDMFLCPFCNCAITNYDGRIARGKPVSPRMLRRVVD